MQRLLIAVWVMLSLLPGSQAVADEFRVERMTPNDLTYIASQQEALDSLARRHFGRQLNGMLANDFSVLQRLLDDQIVTGDQVRLLQGMGLVLGELLKSKRGLKWVIYEDRLGRSRALQVPGFDREFIFPTTQVSRRVEVGLQVSVAQTYRELEQQITKIRNKPPF